MMDSLRPSSLGGKGYSADVGSLLFEQNRGAAGIGLRFTDLGSVVASGRSWVPVRAQVDALRVLSGRV